MVNSLWRNTSARGAANRRKRSSPALQKIYEQQNLPQSPEKKSPPEAVAHIRQSRKGVTLGGLKIKDLIHAGHKY